MSTESTDPWANLTPEIEAMLRRHAPKHKSVNTDWYSVMPKADGKRFLIAYHTCGLAPDQPYFETMGKGRRIIWKEMQARDFTPAEVEVTKYKYVCRCAQFLESRTTCFHIGVLLDHLAVPEAFRSGYVRRTTYNEKKMAAWEKWIEGRTP